MISKLCHLIIPLVLAMLACANPLQNPVSPTATASINKVPTSLPVSTEPSTLAPLTPVPPSPTPSAVPPMPTPTLDPNAADWTILVYMAADNNLELPALFDINEMENAGNSDDINVLVQIDRADGYANDDGDWTTTRRYFIKGDNDLSVTNSDLILDLGETNSGDPKTLANFIAWGVNNYPAHQYALILWDHGSGWLGIAQDDGEANFDDLSLRDLGGGIATGLAQTHLDKLDLVGFDACLMGQLEVFATMQPVANYAVASEDLVPGYGWDYSSLLSNLYANPASTPSEFAKLMVNDFTNYYSTIEPDDFVTMSAVDLSLLPRLTAAVDRLAGALIVNPELTASAVGDARAGAETFARFYPDDVDYYASIDLFHFAGILAQRTDNPALQAIAEDVQSAVRTSVLLDESGVGLRHAEGMAIYFPRTASFMTPAYANETPLAAWNTFLNTYYQNGLSELPAPNLDIISVFNENASLQAPAYLEMEISGRDIESVYLSAGLYEAERRIRLVDTDFLVPEPTILPDGTKLYEWHDGVHEDFYVWYTEGVYVTDGTNGDFVVMYPTSEESNLYVVEGRYRRADESAYFEANLVFDTQSGELIGIWSFQNEEGGAPREILPAFSDEFQLYRHYVTDPNSGAFREAGESLFFGENLTLQFEYLPLPAGLYYLGFEAETIAGKTAFTSRDFNVQNDSATPISRTYLDPYGGFQFVYPSNWRLPAYNGAILYSQSLDERTWLSISQFPDTILTAQDLQATTLTNFGGVTQLYEDTVEIAGISAIRTAYGYTAEKLGERTGIFLTFVSNGTGYVVDVDGAIEDEQATINLVNGIAGSWQYQPIGFGGNAGNWGAVALENFTVAKPEDFGFESLDNGWQIFSAPDSISFVALRTDPASGSDVTTILNEWVQVAGEEVTEFLVNPPFDISLGGHRWTRRNFEYINDSGEKMWGFVMVRLENNREVVAWGEAPLTIFNDLEQNSFSVIISDMALNETGN